MYTLIRIPNLISNIILNNKKENKKGYGKDSSSVDKHGFPEIVNCSKFNSFTKYEI